MRAGIQMRSRTCFGGSIEIDLTASQGIQLYSAWMMASKKGPTKSSQSLKSSKGRLPFSRPGSAVQVTGEAQPLEQKGASMEIGWLGLDLFGDLCDSC